MKDTSRMDEWRSLCELVSQENNPQKLLELITKLNRALEECHQRSRIEASFEVDALWAPLTSSRDDDFDSLSLFRACSVAREYDC